MVYRHALTTRLTHWLSALALAILIFSGLQIFNAAPYLDASDKSDPAHRVLAFGAVRQGVGRASGYVEIFGARVMTGHLLGYTDDGDDGLAPRAFPGWITLPGEQDLADGRRWHLFFAWIFVLAGLVYVARGTISGAFGLLVLRPSDLPKLLPMVMYYLRLRREPPEHGRYNPLQKMAYTGVIFVLAPFVIFTGLALSPGFDAATGPLISVLGGRQFARLWHFVAMIALIGFIGGHLTMVCTTGLFNNMRSMLSGWYAPRANESEGP